MRKIITVLIAFVVVLDLLACASTPVSALGLSSESACLLDGSGNVLYESNARTKMPMASTTKIMTALIVIENADLEKVITVPDESVGVEGSSMYLAKGEHVSIRDLLYALMLQSANDAATALAVTVAGSVEDFAVMMNEKADELGLVNTHFVNPHGLDHPDHYTTAYELAKLTAHAMNNETFASVVSSLKYSYQTDKRAGVFVNHNKLLYSMDGCVGVKTGYTMRCGRCLVSATETEGLRLIAVTLNAPNDWQDHKRMHEYGRSLFEYDLTAEKTALCYTVSVVNGERSQIKLTNADTLAVWHKKNEDVTVVAELPRFLYAPIDEGEICGKLLVYSGATLVAQTDIVSTEECGSIEYPSFFEKLINKIKDFIGTVFNG